MRGHNIPGLEPDKSPAIRLTELHAAYVKGEGAEPSVNTMVNVLNIAGALRTAWTLAELDLANAEIDMKKKAEALENIPMSEDYFDRQDRLDEATDSYNALRISLARIKADARNFAEICTAPGIKESAEPVLKNFPFFQAPSAPAPMGSV